MRDLSGEAYPSGGPGRFILGRAEEVTESLLEAYRGKIQLITIDPPFGTGDTFSVKVPGKKEKLSIPVYSDSLGTEAYMDMMRRVLTASRELLTDTGSIYLHIDYRMSGKMRMLMDELFGERNLVNEIVWTYKSGGRSKKHFSRKHDTILFYRKTPAVYFDIESLGVPRGPVKRNNMKRTIDERGRVCYSIRSGGKTYVYHEDMPVYPSDVWDDIEHMHQRDPERTGFATQKPAALVRRMVRASSKEGDLVADFFSGSGTLASVAAAEGRSFLAVDASPVALSVLRCRQLVKESEPTLFKAGREMTLEYPSLPEADIVAELVSSTEGGRKSVRLERIASPLGVSCVGMGSVDGVGVFRPESYSIVAARGVTLTASASANTFAVFDHAGRVKLFDI